MKLAKMIKEIHRYDGDYIAEWPSKIEKLLERIDELERELKISAEKVENEFKWCR